MKTKQVLLNVFSNYFFQRNWYTIRKTIKWLTIMDTYHKYFPDDHDEINKSHPTNQTSQ